MGYRKEEEKLNGSDKNIRIIDIRDVTITNSNTYNMKMSAVLFYSKERHFKLNLLHDNTHIINFLIRN